MRRFFKCPSLYLWCHRTVIVGPSEGIPTPQRVPKFGKHRAPDTLPKKEESALRGEEYERDAKKVCYESYGFLGKPLFLRSWLEFQKELQRIELCWSLSPGPGGVYSLRIIDHFDTGDGVLCELKGSGAQCSPLAEFFECCGSLTEGSSDSKEIIFYNGPSLVKLIVESKKYIGDSSASDDGSQDVSERAFAQYNCRGTQVSMSILDERSGIRTPLFHNISLQALNYAFLTSIPVFLKRNDIGIRNADFVSKEQMIHFRFAWCFLRRESWLTAVDMNELDVLLPP